MKYSDPDGKEAVTIGLVFCISALFLSSYYALLDYYQSPEVQEANRQLSESISENIENTVDSIKNSFSKKQGKKNSDVKPKNESDTLPKDGVNSGESNKEREHKKPKTGSGKEKADDVPSWAEGESPYEDESGKDFSKRLMDEKYGENNYDRGPGSEYNKLKKWGDRGFE